MKEQYETAKADVKKAEEETRFNFTKKKGIAAEKKEARVEKEEAEKYQRLSRELVSCAQIKSDPFCMHLEMLASTWSSSGLPDKC